MLTVGLRRAGPRGAKKERAMRTDRTSIIFTESAYANFPSFLESSLPSKLLGCNSDAVLVVRELREARVFHYFGVRSSETREPRATLVPPAPHPSCTREACSAENFPRKTENSRTQIR